MAENPIAGALSNLGRTFRGIQQQQIAGRELDLRQRQIESNEVRALEGLRLEGERDVATANLQQAQQEANVRQSEQQFDLQERQFGANVAQGQERNRLLGEEVDIRRGEAESSATNRDEQIKLERRKVAVLEQNQKNLDALGSINQQLAQENLLTAQRRNELLEEKRKSRQLPINSELLINAITQQLKASGAGDADIAARLGPILLVQDSFGLPTNTFVESEETGEQITIPGDTLTTGDVADRIELLGPLLNNVFNGIAQSQTVDEMVRELDEGFRRLPEGTQTITDRGDYILKGVAIRLNSGVFFANEEAIQASAFQIRERLKAERPTATDEQIDALLEDALATARRRSMLSILEQEGVNIPALPSIGSAELQPGNRPQPRASESGFARRPAQAFSLENIRRRPDPEPPGPGGVTGALRNVGRGLDRLIGGVTQNLPR